jgi:glycerol kinase
MKLIISLDSGTTSARAVLFNEDGECLAIVQKEFTQFFPDPGWVEHDPVELFEVQMEVLEELLTKEEARSGEIVGMGITNQRETVVVWDKATGEPVYNAIVWQDKRTVEACQELRASGLSDYCKQVTGLVIDPYFSGTKVAWVLDNVDGARERAERGELCFGTVDSWLLWNLTGGKVHATDVSNASRTLMFNIRTLKWDEGMLRALNVPAALLPEVKESGSVFGEYVSRELGSVPIAAIMGDQQSALFGQACFTPGTAKNTYGTGCFMLMNTGSAIPDSPSGLLNTIAWQVGGKVVYALEGSVFVAGAAMQWLRDGLEILEDVGESSAIAARHAKSHGDSSVVVVPAFSGLGTPYWDMNARGAVFGLTHDSSREALIRATLESLAFQSMDVLQSMQEDSGISLFTLQVDGGASANEYLMQFQSDLLGVSIERPVVVQSTAAGVAFMAAHVLGLKSIPEIKCMREVGKVFTPEKNVEWRESRAVVWSDAVARVRTGDDK